MNPRARKPHPIPAALRQLWREARGLVAWLVTAIDRPALPTTGISRENGTKVSIWLMNIEASVRRLILAAALAFQLPAPRTIACAARSPIPRTHTATRRPGFCVFRLATNDAPPAIPSQLAPASAQARAPRPFAHIAFPADPLLALRTAPRTNTPHAPPHRGATTRHPLDRWIRPVRQDPDWREPDTPSTFFGGPEPEPSLGVDPEDRPEREPRPRAKRDPHDPNALPASLHDWRRCYDEWQKLMPAPDIAARLDALERITQDPRTAIISAARRLARSGRVTAMLARRAPPRTRVPRRATRFYTDHRRIDLPDRCHAQITRVGIAPVDTS